MVVTYYIKLFRTRKQQQHFKVSSPSSCRDNYLRNDDPWRKDNVYKENNPYNVVLTMLGQNYIRKLSVQCCPNTSERTLHKKNTCGMLTQNATLVFTGKPIVVSNVW